MPSAIRRGTRIPKMRGADPLIAFVFMAAICAIAVAWGLTAY